MLHMLQPATPKSISSTFTQFKLITQPRPSESEDLEAIFQAHAYAYSCSGSKKILLGMYPEAEFALVRFPTRVCASEIPFLNTTHAYYVRLDVCEYV